MSLAATVDRIEQLKAEVLDLAGDAAVAALDGGAGEVVRIAVGLETLGKRVAAKAKNWPRETRVDTEPASLPEQPEKPFDWREAQLPPGDQA